VLTSLPQGVRARVFLRRHRVTECSKGFKPLKWLKENVAMSDHKRTSSQGKRRTVGILGGESAKSRESSDLTDKQESYDKSVERF
jgi:hypothetical protein